MARGLGSGLQRRSSWRQGQEEGPRQAAALTGEGEGGASPRKVRREAEWEKLVWAGRGGSLAGGPAGRLLQTVNLAKGGRPGAEGSRSHRKGSRGGPGQINEGSRADEDSAGPGGLTLAPRWCSAAHPLCETDVLSPSLPLALFLRRHSVRSIASAASKHTKLLLLSPFDR